MTLIHLWPHFAVWSYCDSAALPSHQTISGSHILGQ